MSYAFLKMRKLAKTTGLIYIIGGLLGFVLAAFTDVIPPLHDWALQHVLTVSSFITFTVSGIFVVWFVRPTEAKDFVKFATSVGYEATARQKELLDAYRLRGGKTILFLMPTSATFYVSVIYFFVDPEFMSSIYDPSGKGFLLAMFAALNFCIFFILSFAIFMITILRLNVGMKNDPELKEFYKKAIDGFLVTHAELAHRFGVDVVREGAEDVGKEYIDKEEKEFKGLWWLFFGFSIFILSSVSLLAGLVVNRPGIRTIQVPLPLVSTLFAMCLILFYSSLRIPNHSVKKYRYSKSQGRRDEFLTSRSPVYTRPSLSQAGIKGSVLDVMVSLLGALVLVVGIGQVDEWLFISLGYVMMMLSLVGLIGVRLQESKIMKRILKETQMRK